MQANNALGITLLDIARWIELNRHGNDFINWTFEQICFEVFTSAQHSSMLVWVDNSGLIFGYISWLYNVDYANVPYAHIKHFLSSKPGAIKVFLQYAIDNELINTNSNRADKNQINYFYGKRKNGRYFRYEYDVSRKSIRCISANNRARKSV